jgi:hypothetical protein
MEDYGGGVEVLEVCGRRHSVSTREIISTTAHAVKFDVFILWFFSLVYQLASGFPL